MKRPEPKIVVGTNGILEVSHRQPVYLAAYTAPRLEPGETVATVALLVHGHYRVMTCPYTRQGTRYHHFNTYEAARVYVVSWYKRTFKAAPE